MTSSLLQQAASIARHDLRACYLPDGIIAGTHHFTDYWARDGFFASFGALAIGDRQAVENMVDLFFSYQRQDGLIPYRLMRGPVTLGKYLGKPTFYPAPRPTYRLRGFGPEVLDGTTLTALFAVLLKDRSHLPQIKLALRYLASKEKFGLLWDGPMGEWNDSVWKLGNLLYSNVIYLYLYDRLSVWTKAFAPAWSKELLRKKSALASSLRRRLWNGHFFADWYDYRRHDFLYPFGNCLAVAWGLTSKEESASILHAVASQSVSFSIETNSPKYPWWRVDLFQRLVGMSDYQNHSLVWWQPVLAYLAALKKTGQKRLADQLSLQLSQKLVADGCLHECYTRKGSPLRRRLYSAEHPFAWSAGMLLWSLASA